LLAGLVVASFTVTPARRAQVSAAPTVTAEVSADEPAAARIAPMSRGLARSLRIADDVEIELSPAADAVPAQATEPAPAALTQAKFEPEPEATAAPEAPPEPTPDPTRAPTPRPAPAKTPPPVATIANSSMLAAEVHMLELINASRVRGGLVPLVMDVRVADAARAHSAAEARVHYVYHDGPDGTASSRDVPACGTGWYGENTGKIWNDNVDALHIEFMNEPWQPINHRTNIMDPAFRRVGVGAVNGSDAMYMTMVFCR
jgi:uncharacterized protein YkwD